MHEITITHPVLIDLVEARLFDPEPDMFDSISNDVLDRMEAEIYPLFRNSATYRAVVRDTVPRLPFTPSRKYRTVDEKITRVEPIITNVDPPKLPKSGSQESLNMEIDRSKRMLKRLERKLMQAGGPMSPEALEAGVRK